jgi:hypothetical protein
MLILQFKYNYSGLYLYISAKKFVMKFYEKQPTRSKVVMTEQPIEQVQSFTFLGCKLTHWAEGGMNWKITQFSYMCRTVRKAMKGIARLESHLKFY